MEGDRQTPVEQVDLSEASDHHVRGFDVAVDDSSLVSKRDGPRHADQHPNVPLQWVGLVFLRNQSRVADDLVPRASLDSLQDDLRLAVFVEHQVVNGHDVRMLKRSGDECLPQEEVVMILVLLEQCLDRDLALQGLLHTDMNRSLAPRPDDRSELDQFTVSALFVREQSLWLLSG